jgi:hypothetical protein
MHMAISQVARVIPMTSCTPPVAALQLPLMLSWAITVSG